MEGKKINWLGGIFAVVILAILVVFSSCTHTKDLQKTDTTVKVDSTAKVNSVTTSTETTVGTLVVKGDTVSGSVKADELKNDPLIIEDDNIKLTVTEDDKGVIHASAIQKPKTIPVNTTKITNNKTNSETKVKRTTDTETKDVKKEVKGVNWTFIIAIPVTIITILLLFFIWRKKKQVQTIIDKI